MDSKVVRIWDRQSGKPFSSVEAPPDVPFNDVAIYPNSGLMMMANEQPKMQVHYIPSMGPAPKWCSFLDNITEEIEESQVENYRLCKKTFHIFFVNSAPNLEFIRVVIGALASRPAAPGPLSTTDRRNFLILLIRPIQHF